MLPVGTRAFLSARSTLKTKPVPLIFCQISIKNMATEAYQEAYCPTLVAQGVSVRLTGFPDSTRRGDVETGTQQSNSRCTSFYTF